MSLQAANFRSGHDAESARALGDIGWIPFVRPFGPPFIQSVAIAVTVSETDIHPSNCPRIG
jgi:hypothetical protein